MLINIWFNYSFDSCFGIKMLSWSSNFFSLNLIPIFEKTNVIRSFMINFVKFLETDQ